MFAHDTTRIAPAAHTRAACIIPSSGALAGEASEIPEAFPRDYRFRLGGTLKMICSVRETGWKLAGYLDTQIY
jgi:hypothetical protein